MVLLVLIPVFLLFGIAGPAEAFQLGVQDQGAGTDTLAGVAGILGAQSIRIIARPGEPHLAQVRAYHQAGYRVQAAVLLKRTNTPNDVRVLLREWNANGARMVQTVSVGNEPELNGIRPCEYAQLYRRTSALIRREFPGVRVGFGEFSPTDPIGYAQRVLACPGPRLIADSFNGHFYQFHSDPLAPANQERAMGAGIPTWTGLGDLRRVRRFLDSRVVRSRLSTRSGRPLPIGCTEFTYLTSGGYGTTMAKAAAMVPRAIKQARRWCQQLVWYGLGEVYPTSNWGNACLLDGFGQPTSAYHALARALGRVLREKPAPYPPVVVRTALPDLSPDRPPFVPISEAASVDPPVVIEDPVPDAPSEGPSEPAAPVDDPAEPSTPAPIPAPAPEEND